MAEVLSLDFLVSSIAQEIIGTFFAIAVAYLLRKLWREFRYGGWEAVVIKPDGAIGTIRGIGLNKAEEILDDLTTMSVFLKGLASPYGWLSVDLVTEGVEMNALVIDRSAKKITVDLSVDGVVKQR